MGIFSQLFGKKKENTTLVAKETNIFQLSPDSFPVHHDIADLLWIGDGPKRNYSPNNSENVYEIDGLKITFSFMGQEEPSLIYIKQPIMSIPDMSKIERPLYYPTYTGLTPEQRGVYWKMLANPYDPNYDIGFVFVLYYGLERHLLTGNYEKAFRVILRLRDIHSNASFQSYSANALILTALCRQRADLAYEFVNSLDNEYELNFSDNLYLLCKYGLNLPVNAKEIMRFAKSFEFNNTNYIKNNSELFESTLINNIQEKYGTTDLYINEFISSTESRKLYKKEVSIFANTSIRQKTTEVPLIVDSFKLKKAMYDLLEITHNQVKVKVAELRKMGALPSKKEPSAKEIKIITFDTETERILLGELSKHKINNLDRHFALIALQDFYYKFRDVDKIYLEKCIECCWIDINALSDMQRVYYADEVNYIRQNEAILGKGDAAKRIAKIAPFNGNIPAFKRLSIIYEKQKEYGKAIQICEAAISYYFEVKQPASASEFTERKFKLERKK